MRLVAGADARQHSILQGPPGVREAQGHALHRVQPPLQGERFSVKSGLFGIADRLLQGLSKEAVDAVFDKCYADTRPFEKGVDH